MTTTTQPLSGLGPSVGDTARPGSLGCFAALVVRDLMVLRNNVRFFALRVVMQPLLFLFIFAYVFPRIGQGVGGADGSTVFATLLVPGTMAIASFTQGVNGTALPLITDLGFARQIEYRALAPISMRLLAAEKLLVGTVEGTLAAAITLPLALLVPNNDPALSFNWPAFVVAFVVAGATGAALGLALGTWISPQHIPQMFSFLVVPLTFLGASYFPWRALGDVVWLKWIVLLNPLVYVNEALRYAMTPTIPHMAFYVSFPAMVLWAVGLFVFGARQLERRIQGL